MNRADSGYASEASNIEDDGWDPHYVNLNADINGEPTTINLPHPDKPIGFRTPCRIYVRSNLESNHFHSGPLNAFYPPI
jgi:hypothetical protein